MLYSENFDEFVSLISYGYSLFIVPKIVIICLLSFISAVIFKKRQKKFIIFRYLYSNTICDILMNSIGNFLAIIYFMYSSDVFHRIYFVCGFSLVRSINLCSCLLSLLIMTQRFIYVHYHSHWLKRHTTLIIALTIVASFAIMTPFCIINTIKQIDDTILNSDNQTSGLFIHFYKTVSPFLSIFRNDFFIIFF